MTINIGSVVPPKPDPFISRSAIESNLFSQLSEFVNIKSIPYDKLDFSKFRMNPPIDYVWVDLSRWSLHLFKLREEGKIDCPFIVILHVIHTQFVDVSNMFLFLKKEDVLIVTSAFSEQTIRLISSSHRVVRVPFSIDRDRIKNTLSSKPDQTPTICYLGRLHREKGIEVLIDCLPEIIERVGEVKLKIIGPYSGFLISNKRSAYFESLLNQAKNLDVSKNIEWMGAILDDKKYKIMSESDVLINPSLVPSETFGIVNIEAFASGIPVVCSGNKAFSEIVQHGINGYIINHTAVKDGFFELDKREIIDYTCNLLSSNDHLEKLKENAKKTSYNYDKKVVIPKLISLLKNKSSHHNLNPTLDLNDELFEFEEFYTKEWFSYLKSLGLTSLSLKELLRINSNLSSLDKGALAKANEYLMSSCFD